MADEPGDIFDRAQIAAGSGDLVQAIRLYDEIISSRGDHAAARYKRANLLKDCGRLESALADYDRAIALDPRHAHAFCNRGVVLARLNRLDAACESYEQAIALDPADPLVHYNHGAVLRDMQQPLRALASYDEAVALKPDYAEAYCNRGILLAELGRGDAALASYDRAIEIQPGFSPAYFNRGVLFQQRKQPDAALSNYNRVIEIDPDHAAAHVNRGVVLTALGQWEAALASLDRAIAIDPHHAEAHCGRGNLLLRVNQTGAAIEGFDRALALKPDYAEAFYDRAGALMGERDVVAAIASYDRAFALKPDLPFLTGARRHAKMHVCDWRDFETDLRLLASGIDAGTAVSSPLPVLALIDSATLQQQAACIWVREQHPANPSPTEKLRRTPADRIRIGYFSADFHEHPVAVLMAGVFENHDRSMFEVTAFSFGPVAGDGLRARLEKAFERFIDVRRLADLEIAELARSLGIDVAVDLGGHTGNSRTGIFALRAAPTQINFLGYPGTMGAGYMDYMIADETVIPPESRCHYTERIAYLRGSCLPNDSGRSIAERRFSRIELGLPEFGFVFCCFNNSHKITPDVFDGWMRILRRVGQSVLWLSQQDPAAADNLRQEAARRGVDARRLVFAGRMASPAEHLSRLRAADLFLDTRPYNAHATAVDSLCAGVPVLTCAGGAFAARVAASLLTSVVLPELITSTPAQYEDLAVALAMDPPRMTGIRERLERSRLDRAPLASRTFAGRLESIYRQVVERYRADLPPRHIEPADGAGSR
jgi:predicted O-linked N-acetylglucosamine transferase (SPINDLY family)